MRISDWSSDVCSSDLRDDRYIDRAFEIASSIITDARADIAAKIVARLNSREQNCAPRRTTAEQGSLGAFQNLYGLQIVERRRPSQAANLHFVDIGQHTRARIADRVKRLTADRVIEGI